MSEAFDTEWYRALKASLQDLTASERKAVELVWKNPGVPVYQLPQKGGGKRGGAIWLAIGNRIAKKKLWPKMPRHVRAQNSRPGYLPFYSGVLVELSTVINRAGRRWVCFDFHPEAVRALRDLRIIKGTQPPRSVEFVSVSQFVADDPVVAMGMAAESKKVLRAIASRRGQPRFRNALLQAYGGACAVTGCTERAVLEAAHIKAHSRKGRYEAQNGLLLRADWHLLFDMNLWAIHPTTGQIRLSNKIEDRTYSRFAGKIVTLPQDLKLAPSPQALADRYRTFMKRDGR